MVKFQRKIVRAAPEEVSTKRGRPSRQDRLAKLTEFQIDRLTAEAGKPLEKLPMAELEGLIRSVAKERGWTDLV